MPETEPRVIKSIHWTGGELSLNEVCRLIRDQDGHVLTGTVIGEFDNLLLEVRYTVRCSVQWQTQSVGLSVRRQGEFDHVSLIRDHAGNWKRDGADLPRLRGVSDVDIAVTPSTNTLPIRRLDLAVGESREVTAAWVRFPSLEIQPLTQRYTRTSDVRYTYESAGGKFRAELEVDEHGLVTRYGNYWRVRM